MSGFWLQEGARARETRVPEQSLALIAGGRTGVRFVYPGTGPEVFQQSPQGACTRSWGLGCTVGVVTDWTVAPSPPSCAVGVAAGVSR